MFSSIRFMIIGTCTGIYNMLKTLKHTFYRDISEKIVDFNLAKATVNFRGFFTSFIIVFIHDNLQIYENIVHFYNIECKSEWTRHKRLHQRSDGSLLTKMCRGGTLAPWPNPDIQYIDLCII